MWKAVEAGIEKTRIEKNKKRWRNNNKKKGKK